MLPKTTEQQASQIVELLKSQPSINYSEIQRQTGVSLARIKTVCKKNNISRKKVKDHIADLLREHPYWSYPVISNMTGYGKGNVARLAKAIGCERTSSDILANKLQDVDSQLKANGCLDIKALSMKYGLPADSFKEIEKQMQLKSNRKTNKNTVCELLKNTKLNFSCIAFLAGCDLSYVSRIAKENDIKRTERNNQVDYNLIVILKNRDTTCVELLSAMPRASAEIILDACLKNNISLKIAPEKDEQKIIDAFKKTNSVLNTYVQTGFNEYLIEIILKENGLISSSEPKDQLCIDFLKSHSGATIIEAARHFDYYACFIKDAIQKENIKRNLTICNSDNKPFIINLLINRRDLSYEIIADMATSSVGTVFKIAKEECITRNHKRK